jgi:endonuclease YncB( thermonuclease family)
VNPLLVLLVLLTANGAATGATLPHWTGRVIHVVDGDTLDVLAGKQRIRVRLIEIDAPESGQLESIRARQSLIQICGGEIATVESSGRDRNGWVLARISCNGIDANAEQVRRGMAWVFDGYAKLDSPLYALQEEARSAGRGLWAQKEPVPPWEWRRRHAHYGP